MAQPTHDGSKLNWNVVIPAALTLISTCFLGYLTYLTAQVHETAQATAKKVEVVRTDLVKSDKKVDGKLDVIHKDTNGNLTKLTKELEEIKRQLAEEKKKP